MVFAALVVIKIIYIFKIRYDYEIQYKKMEQIILWNNIGKLTQKVEVSMFAQAIYYKWFEYVNQECN